MSIFFSLIIRKFLANHDTAEKQKKAYDWAAANAVDYVEVL